MYAHPDTQFCDNFSCMRRVFKPNIYCDEHVDNASTPPGVLSAATKLRAVETYLQWSMDTEDEVRDILNRIHMVVMEDTILPHPNEVK